MAVGNLAHRDYMNQKLTGSDLEKWGQGLGSSSDAGKLMRPKAKSRLCGWSDPGSSAGSLTFTVSMNLDKFLNLLIFSFLFRKMEVTPLTLWFVED